MSKNKIEVNMNVYDIPIVIEELEKSQDTIKKLQQENQQLKKQKDDVVELIKKQLLSNTNITKYTDEMCLRDILRMLGEIDVED